jgi:hypothetical protein
MMSPHMYQMGGLCRIGRTAPAIEKAGAPDRETPPRCFPKAGGRPPLPPRLVGEPRVHLDVVLPEDNRREGLGAAEEQ